MRTLSLDFASHGSTELTTGSAHLACLDDGVVRAIRLVGRVNDTEMISLLEGVLAEAGWAVADIGRIACNVGPGGFTSVRGGVVFANALADQLHVPIAGYHGSALALARTGASWWFHSTKADALFAFGGPWSEPTLVSLEEAITAIRDGAALCGDLLDTHRTALAERGAIFPTPAALEAVLPGFLGGLTYDAKGLVPWYGRGL